VLISYPKLTYMKLETILSFRMPRILAKSVSALPYVTRLQTFNVPPPAGILGAVWDEHDVR